jgi:glycerol-3-phosphate dehydrogenase (NAD(P)+)
MKIAIMGWGVYGRALGSLLTYNKVDFTPVDVDRPLTHEVELLIQVVPTQFIRQAFKTNAGFFNPDMAVVNAAKGIEKKTNQLPYQIIQELGYQNYYSLMGPSFAAGIIDQDPTLVSLGYANEENVRTIVKLLQTPYFRIQRTADYESLELAAAMKNVYAILCGYAEGLGLGANTRAKLITLALQEIVKLGEAMGQSVDILASGTVGDLMLTCSSVESRNFQFGKNLAKMDAEHALKQVGTTVEGFYTSQSMAALSKKYTVKLPVAKLISHLIKDSSAGQQQFHDFVAAL